MKKYIIVLFAALGMASCKKDGLFSEADRNKLTSGSYLKLISSQNTIDYSALSTTSVQVKVQEIGAPVDKINLYIVEGANQDTGSWKFVRSVPGTGGENTFEVKATEIATSLGVQPADLSPGNQYTLYSEIITKDGRKFNIANANADLAGQPEIAAFFFITSAVVCPFDASVFNGEFEVVTDEWGDHVAGDIINIIAGPAANQLTLIKPYGGSNKKDIVVDVAAATGVATVETQVYGDYPGAPDIEVSTGGGASFAFSCIGVLTLNLNHFSHDFGDQGDYTLTLKKK